METYELIRQLATCRTSEELQSRFMDCGQFILPTTGWGIDLIGQQNNELTVQNSELAGVPIAVCDRYQNSCNENNVMMQAMFQNCLPFHNLSLQSRHAWQNSPIYQEVFQPFALEHVAIAPLFNREAQIFGYIYFLRNHECSVFTNQDLLKIANLANLLSMNFMALQVPELTEYLTPREREIVNCVAKGFSNRDIAAQLYVSPETVKHSLKRLFRKFAVSNRAELIAKLSGWFQNFTSSNS